MNRHRSSRIPQQCIYNCFGCIFIKRIMIRNMIQSGELAEIELVNLIDRIEIDHLTPYNDIANVLLRVKIYKKMTSSAAPYMQFIMKIIKVPKDESRVLTDAFANEVLFYSKIGKHFKKYIFPLTKEATICWKEFQQPLIMMEDISMLGYNRVPGELNKRSLRKYLGALALFHGNTMRIFDERTTSFKNFVLHAVSGNKAQEKRKQEEAARAFLEGPVWHGLDTLLKRKVKAKLEKVKHLETSIVSTLIHGAFTRSHVFFKQKDETRHYIKVIDFQSIRLSSPVIDFGRIVFTNLPNTSSILDMRDFIKRMLQTYIYELRKVYPEVDCKAVYKELTNHMIFPYVNMIPEEYARIKSHLVLLHALDMLCCFN